MPESRVARADRRADAMLRRLGDELRVARLIASLRLRDVGAEVGISASELSRIERGLAPWVDVSTLTRIAGVVGLDLWVRTYPGSEPLRDIAHLRLINAFRALIGHGLRVRTEVPVGDPRDLRAWDMTLMDRLGAACGTELETRLFDAQDQVRRITRKVADGRLDRVLLVIADTRANRAAVQAASGLLSGVFAIDDAGAYEALAQGRIPPRDALIFVRLPPHGNGTRSARERRPLMPPDGNQ